MRWQRTGYARASTQAPWVTGGDTQMPPNQFMTGANEHPHEGAPPVLVAAASGTRRVRQDWTNTVWSLPGPLLEPCSDGAQAIPWPSWPHVPALLRFTSDTKPALVLKQAVPKFCRRQCPQVACAHQCHTRSSGKIARGKIQTSRRTSRTCVKRCRLTRVGCTTLLSRAM